MPDQTNKDTMAEDKGLVSYMEGRTDAEGLVSFAVPPESRVFAVSPPPPRGRC